MRTGSIDSDVAADQAEEGGASPAPVLHVDCAHSLRAAKTMAQQRMEQGWKYVRIEKQANPTRLPGVIPITHYVYFHASRMA